MEMLFVVAAVIGLVALQPNWRSIAAGLLLILAFAWEAAQRITAIGVAPGLLELVTGIGVYVLLAAFYVLWRQVALDRRSAQLMH